MFLQRVWLGRYFFENGQLKPITVDSERYQTMITNFLMPSVCRKCMQNFWFQHNGTPCHTSTEMINLLVIPSWSLNIKKMPISSGQPFAWHQILNLFVAIFEVKSIHQQTTNFGWTKDQYRKGKSGYTKSNVMGNTKKPSHYIIRAKGEDFNQIMFNKSFKCIFLDQN